MGGHYFLHPLYYALQTFRLITLASLSSISRSLSDCSGPDATG
jgi:hypothetical protein